MKITIAHSPDPDDAFMHYALACGKIDTEGFEFETVTEDIESLNFAARLGRYEVCAVSIRAYPWVADRYALLDHGGSLGEGYGPIVVSREPLQPADLAGERVAIPGVWTTANLVLQLAQPDCRRELHPFDRIPARVAEGRVRAGVIIHEGQLTYEETGLHPVLDLGVWWSADTGGLPLPLGGNAIRRDLAPEARKTVSRLLKRSIEYALSNRDEALDYAQRFGRGLSREQTDRFVGMYVNDRTLSYGEEGRAAIRELIRRGQQLEQLQPVPDVEFVE